MPQVPLSRLRRGERFTTTAVMEVGYAHSAWVVIPDHGKEVLVDTDTLVTVTDELYAEIQRRDNEHP